MAKISSIIICHNELDFIGRALQSLSECDEIWVIDSFSTDGTFDYVKKHFPKANAVQRAFQNYAEQKNWAIDQCSHDWICLLDADEWVAWDWPQVKNMLKGSKAVAYSFPRINYYMGKKMRFSGLQNDRVVRLIHKQFNRFNDRWVHESIISSGKVIATGLPIHHNTFKSVSHQILKINSYSGLKAKEKLRNNKTGGFASLLFKPLWMFVRLYGFRMGFLDGKQGLIYCYFSALSVFFRQVKLWRREEN
jgi:glycosyltransferase involved in cell wall biosynthesis